MLKRLRRLSSPNTNYQIRTTAFMSHRTPLKVITFAVLVVGIAIGFGGGFIFAKSVGQDVGIGEGFRRIEGFPDIVKVFGTQDPTFELLQEGVEVITEKYVNGTDITEKD